MLIKIRESEGSVTRACAILRASRLELSERTEIRTKIRLHIPFEIAIKGSWVEVVEKVHTTKTPIPASVEIEIAIDLAVIRIDKVTLIVKPRPDAEAVTPVGVRVRITILVDIRSDDFSSHAESFDDLTGVAGVWSDSQSYPSRGGYHFLLAGFPHNIRLARNYLCPTFGIVPSNLYDNTSYDAASIPSMRAIQYLPCS